MRLRLRSFFTMLPAPVVALLLMVPAGVLAQDHVVSQHDLRHELATAAQRRHDNVAKLQRFFSSEPARKALAAAKMDPLKVEKAIPFLSDQELARLASQAVQVESDFAGSGITLTNQQVTYIIIGVIAIAVIAIIAAR